MATAPLTTKPTPERIFKHAKRVSEHSGSQDSVRTGSFHGDRRRPDQPATLAKKVGVAERGARILADYLTVQGFLTKESDRYALAPETAVFLDAGRPPIWDR